MSASVRREYQLSALGVPRPETLTLPSFSSRVQSVTVDNTSNGAVGIWFDRDPVGVPSTTVPANSFKTIPTSCQRVGIGFVAAGNTVPQGTIYVELTDVKLSASAGTSIGAGSGATAQWDQSNFDSGATMGA